MSALDLIHGRLIFGRRVRCLGAALAERLPAGSVLDVGCGDGSVAVEVMDRRPDVTITGVDVLVRASPQIEVEQFDGRTLPFPDDSFDAVCFVDVLHHTDDPSVLLHEAARVARDRVVIKDHLADGVAAEPTLRLMDWVGNARHGVRLPYNYLTHREWSTRLADAGLRVEGWDTDLSLYPPPLTWVFDRSLHVVISADAPRPQP